MAFAGRALRDEEHREEEQRGYFNILQVTITAYFGREKKNRIECICEFLWLEPSACIFGCNASRVEKQDVE